MTSLSINQLYESMPEVETDSFERLNPLTDNGSLTEAEIVDVRLSAQCSRAGIIVDLRSSLHFVGPNVALVVLTGVSKVSWGNRDSHLWGPNSWGPFYASWEPTAAGSEYTLEIPGITVGAVLTVSATGAQMYVGNIEELYDDSPIPDMSKESDAVIIAGYPRWLSVMTVREHYRYPESEPARYTCVVCGYPDLGDLPVGPGGRRGVTCPSCGFQFDHTDTDLHYTYEEWRHSWVANGMSWSSTDKHPPPDWAPAEHVTNAAPLRSDRYVCLVCGYPELTKPYGDFFRPSYEICPCCGYQYGYDDYIWTPIDRRQKWMDDGMRWWSHDGPPDDWDPQQQLRRLEAMPRGRQVNGLELGGRRLQCF